MGMNQFQSTSFHKGIVALAVLLLVGSTWGAVIYQENFNGGSGALNGMAPSVTQDGAVWQAGANVSADGGLGSMFTAALPFVPEIGQTYEVVAQFENQGDWAAIGFFSDMNNINLDTRFLDNNPLLWALVRQDGNTSGDQVFLGPGTNGGVGTSTTSSAQEIRIQLETTSATQWTVTWFFDGSQQFQQDINPSDYNIDSVGFGVNGMFSTVSGQILSFEVSDSTNADLASNPSPADKATDVYVKKVLQWAPGQDAETRNVYFGTDVNSVIQATLTNPMDVLIAQDLDVNALALDAPLTLGTTYYWRVDEVNGAPDYGVNTGSVWSFTAEPVGFPIDGNAITVTASGQNEMDTGPENTINGSGLNALGQHSMDKTDMWMDTLDDPNGVWIQYEFDDVYKLYQMKIWNANPSHENILGMGVKDANIETSLDGQTWTPFGDTRVIAQASGSADYQANTLIDMNGVSTKFVRINVLSHWSMLPTVKQVGLSEVRFLYYPTKARLSIPTDGANVKRLDLDLQWRSARDVNSHDVYLGLDPNALSLVGNTTDPVYSPNNLQYDRTYYWRVDEVNGDTVYPGPVWSFTTPPYVVVDNMESYNDTDHFIYDSWVDGWQKADNGSVVGYSTAPFAEATIVHGGGQSMPYAYTTTDSVTARATLDLGSQDWSQGGLSTLVLYVLGERDNQGGQLFVELNGNGNKVVPDASLNSGLWTQVNVDLASLGADLTQVKTLTIGVQGVGSGQLYIDDIRLYRDAPTVAAPVDPGTNGLALWYQMEGNVKDSSNNHYDGTVDGLPLYVDSLSGYAQALQLDGVENDVNMPIGSLIAGLTDCSFSGWIQIDPTSTGSWQRLFDVGTGTANYLFLSPRISTNGGVRTAILTSSMSTETGVSTSAELSDGWHHLAVVFGDGTMTLYVDGWPAGTVSTEVYPQDLGQTNQNWLGKSQWPNDSLLMGTLDDFRIYNRSLSDGEIRYLAGDR